MKLKLLGLFIVMLIVSNHDLFGQKVKIKKGEIFIDDVHRGFVSGDRKGVFKNRFYFLGLSKDTLFIVGYQNIPSPLDSSDYSYQYPFVDVPKFKRRVHYPFRKKYYFNDNSIVEHFLEEKAVSKELTVEDTNMTVLLDKGEQAPPPRLISILNEERASLSNIDFIAPRLVLKDPKEMSKVVLEIMRLKSYSTRTEFERTPDIEGIDEYYIRQAYTTTGNDATVMSADLGKIIVKSRTSMMNKEVKSRIFVYNVKGGLVAHLGGGTFGKLSVYNGRITQTFMQQEFNKELDFNVRLRKLVVYLIQTKKL